MQEEVKQDKPKKAKKVRTPEQKRRSRVIGGIVAGSIIGVIALVIAVLAIINAVGYKGLLEQAKAMDKVQYAEGEQLVPAKDADGYWTFTMKAGDEEFDVMQLTDVHIGAGFMSTQKDAWAMNAVATMIRQRKPDLVIVTGDIAYPVPFQAGTFNNLRAAEIFAYEMESLGVYWTFAFGNHDTEAYSSYTRKDISDWYAKQGFTYCLFDANNDIADQEAAEDFGYGNSIIKVKDSDNKVIQALVTFDSHSYTDKDYMGLLWKYDNIHQSQIDWYSDEMAKIREANGNTPVKNLAFFHIPLREYRKAWGELVEANAQALAQYKTSVNYDTMTKDEQKAEMRKYDTQQLQDTANVHRVYGYNGEIVGASLNPLAKEAEPTYGVYCGVPKAELDGKLWAAAKANDMQGTFCGHDHINNFSVDYTYDGYTMRLSYGYSIDYLAYSGIFQEHSQRGCTYITIKKDGSFENKLLNYYLDFDSVEPEAGETTDITK